MLKYFNDNYMDGRTPIDMGLLEEIFKEVVKIVSDSTLENINYKKLILLFLSGINYYFYLHPEQYVDFGKFVAYRSVDMKNLLTLEVKEGESAHTIYEYFKNGGLEVEEVTKLVREYTTDLYKHSSNRLKELSNDIEKLSNLVSQDEEYSNNKHKET